MRRILEVFNKLIYIGKGFITRAFGLFSIILMLGFNSQYCLAQTVSDIHEIERLTSIGIKTAYNSAVKISLYDSVQKKTISVFSGVVVSADGLILSAAHAVKTNQAYLIQFNDGKIANAIGLGRIALKQRRRKLDMAMIQILDKGEWTFAELGSSTMLKLNQPTISISYPSSSIGLLPNIRFGVVAGTDVSSGYFVSTCKMEPGDSGGPIFDVDGKLIGIHSFIQTNENANYEVPINLYRKYWTALSSPVDYKEYPDTSQWQDYPSKPLKIASIQSLQKIPKKLANSTVILSSNVRGADRAVLGTLVKVTNDGKELNYIITKSSQLGEAALLFYGNKKLPIQVIARDKVNDLALLEVPRSLKLPFIKLENKDTIDIKFDNLGKFLFSPLGNEQQNTSVLSSMFVQMTRRFSIGYFGASAKFIEKQITITGLVKGSPAAAVLQLKDQIVGINDKAVSKPTEYNEEFKQFSVGDSVKLKAVREGKELEFTISLTQNNSYNPGTEKFDGGRSEVSDGFSRVLFHDGNIPSDKCGGPVFDSNGNFYGINIARHSRTITVIMPTAIIIDFIKNNS